MYSTPGSDLQVCQSRNLTCCTKKMEERYQVAARRDVQNLLQTSSSSLSFLISRNVAAFQETFESLMKASENHTLLVLQASYRTMAGEASGLVRELFTDVGLFLLGSKLNVDDITSRFFDSLFPLVYNHLINPSLNHVTPGYAECVRSARRDLNPFGAAPGVLANQIGRSGVGGRVSLQALHLGVEVINTTDHLVFSRECRRALLRMQYCPHCHGLTLSKPCMGYCLNVMRGCLASVAEVDPHWREFVRSLEGLSSRMHGTQDLEQVLLGVHTVVRDAVAHAQKNGPHLSAQVRCCRRVVVPPLIPSGQKRLSRLLTRERLLAHPQWSEEVVQTVNQREAGSSSPISSGTYEHGWVPNGPLFPTSGFSNWHPGSSGLAPKFSGSNKGFYF
uniref:Glypican 5a n=1 Tax=Hucho hucho TaxID=62062 RepID=A0A4W5KRU5_9TELE